MPIVRCQTIRCGESRGKVQQSEIFKGPLIRKNLCAAPNTRVGGIGSEFNTKVVSAKQEAPEREREREQG